MTVFKNTFHGEQLIRNVFVSLKVLQSQGLSNKIMSCHNYMA